MPASCVVEVASHKTLENAGLYSIRGKRGFFFELLPELARAGQARISFLRVDDHPVAWQLELLSPGHSYLHHLSYDEEWKKYSPGKQLLKLCLERCWEEGRVVDFLPAPLLIKRIMRTIQFQPTSFIGLLNQFVGEWPVDSSTGICSGGKKCATVHPVSTPRLPANRYLID